MSRSRKKTAVGAVTSAVSEKEDKKAWHKKYRRKNKELARQDSGAGETEYPRVREISDVWDMDKDGKMRYAADEQGKNTRK